MCTVNWGKHYWDIDLNSGEFECPADCVVYFQLDLAKGKVLLKT